MCYKFFYCPKLNPSDQHYSLQQQPIWYLHFLSLSLHQQQIYFLHENHVNFQEHQLKMVYPSVKTFTISLLYFNMKSLLNALYLLSFFSLSNSLLGPSNPLLTLFKVEYCSTDSQSMLSSYWHGMYVCIFLSSMFDFLPPHMVGSFSSFSFQLKPSLSCLPYPYYLKQYASIILYPSTLFLYIIVLTTICNYVAIYYLCTYLFYFSHVNVYSTRSGNLLSLILYCIPNA